MKERTIVFELEGKRYSSTKELRGEHPRTDLLIIGFRTEMTATVDISDDPRILRSNVSSEQIEKIKEQIQKEVFETEENIQEENRLVIILGKY